MKWTASRVSIRLVIHVIRGLNFLDLSSIFYLFIWVLYDSNALNGVLLIILKQLLLIICIPLV